MTATSNETPQSSTRQSSSTQPDAVPSDADQATADKHANVQGFGDRYGYDTSYMHEMLDNSPNGFEAFQNFLPMGHVRQSLPVDAYFVAMLTSMRAEDCGACFQLNVRMAIEAGIDPAIVQGVIGSGDTLEPRLAQIKKFASEISPSGFIDDDLRAAMDRDYSKQELYEFGLVIASTKVYPAIKRVLGYALACDLPNIEVAGPVTASADES